MKKVLIVTLLFTTCFGASAQSPAAAERKKEQNFLFIGSNIDTTLLNYVQTYQYVSKRGDDIPDMFRALRQQAQSKGANCFLFRGFVRNDSTKVMTLTLAAFQASDNMHIAIRDSQPKNRVYVFGDDEFSDKDFSFSFNKEKVTIKSGEFFRHQLKEGEVIKISKGGFTGSSAEIHWAPNKTCRFFTLSGFGFSDSQYQPAMHGAVGASFTTGKLNPVESNLGLLLERVLVVKESGAP